MGLESVFLVLLGALIVLMYIIAFFVGSEDNPD